MWPLCRVSGTDPAPPVARFRRICLDRFHSCRQKIRMFSISGYFGAFAVGLESASRTDVHVAGHQPAHLRTSANVPRGPLLKS